MIINFDYLPGELFVKILCSSLLFAARQLRSCSAQFSNNLAESEVEN